MNLSPGAAVPLENIKVYNSLGSHEGDRLKNIFSCCGRRWNTTLGGHRIIKLNLMTVVQ